MYTYVVNTYIISPFTQESMVLQKTKPIKMAKIQNNTKNTSEKYTDKHELSR